MNHTARSLLPVLLVVAGLIYGSCAVVGGLWASHHGVLGPLLRWPLALGFGRLVMVVFWITVVTSLYRPSRRSPTV